MSARCKRTNGGERRKRRTAKDELAFLRGQVGVGVERVGALPRFVGGTPAVAVGVVSDPATTTAVLEQRQPDFEQGRASSYQVEVIRGRVDDLEALLHDRLDMCGRNPYAAQELSVIVA